jgi:hypothetical protein
MTRGNIVQLRQKGRLALRKGEGEGVHFFKAKLVFAKKGAPHLSPLPFAKGRGGRTVNPRTASCVKSTQQRRLRSPRYPA